MNLDERLRAAWGPDTTADPALWSPDNPAWGQCAVSALLIQDELGGDLLRSTVGGVSHYWNMLPDGSEKDATREQFGRAVVIPDAPPAVRDRDYVLSFPATAERYRILRERFDAA